MYIIFINLLNLLQTIILDKPMTTQICKNTQQFLEIFNNNEIFSSANKKHQIWQIWGKFIV